MFVVWLSTIGFNQSLVLLLQVDNTTLHKLSTMENYGWGDLGTTLDVSCTDDMLHDTVFGISPFYIGKG